MATTQNNDDFDDELLSAYVDDELTAAERQAVEARLRTDARARRLVDELRELSSVICALPRQATPPQLRAQVLAEVDAADDAHEGPVSIPINRWEGYRRGMAWSALAIAATLMLMFTQPTNDEGELADATTKPATGDQQESLAKSRVERGLAAAPEMRAAGGESGATAPPAAELAAAPAVQKQLEDETPPPAAPAPVAPAESSSAEIVASREGASGLPAAATAPISGSRGSELAKSAPDASAVAGAPVASRYGSAAELGGADKLARRATPVVELQDIEGRGSQRLRVLLARNKILLTGGESAEPPPTQSPAADKPHRDEAILVQASPMQIASLLADCQAESHAFTGAARGSESKSLRDAAYAADGASDESFGSASSRHDDQPGQADPLSSSDHRSGRARQLSAEEHREVMAALPAARATGRLAVPADALPGIAERSKRNDAGAGAKKAPQPASGMADRDESRPTEVGDATEQIQVLILLRRAQ